MESEAKIVDVSEAKIEREPIIGLEVVVKGTLVDGIVVPIEVEIRQS
ncbi:hypothetical protein ACFLT8_02630 [Chloroflexota bacterium]